MIIIAEKVYKIKMKVCKELLDDKDKICYSKIKKENNYYGK